MKIFLNKLDIKIQDSLAREVSKIITKSPLFTPTIPRWGKPFRTKITNAGEWGWKSDKKGYGYIKNHPKTGENWPEIPKIFKDLWFNFSGTKEIPNNLLINLYENKEARLGIHQDKDENDYSIPVVSISLGNKAIFNYGKEKKKMRKIILTSGSVVVMGGNSRLFYHSVSKILEDDSNRFNSLNLPNIPKGCRINVTLRKFSKRSDFL